MVIMTKNDEKYRPFTLTVTIFATICIVDKNDGSDRVVSPTSGL